MDYEAIEFALALRARQGDREALAELVERTRQRLFALAYAELRHYEDAQDAVASALLKICLHIGELRQPERIRAWMHTIVRNETHRLRRGQAAATSSLEQTELPAASAEPSLMRLDIERVLRRLHADQAHAVRLYYLEGLSTPEIAARMGRSEGTITSWLHRGRRHLAIQMKEYAPMTTPETETVQPVETRRDAAILHTGLELPLVQTLTETLRVAGYHPSVLTPGELPALLESLRQNQLIVLDEWIDGHPALELVIHLRAHPETSEIPLYVLCSEPSDLAATAYFSIGVDRLVPKADVSEIARVAEPRPMGPGFWGHFTERARTVISHAREEAERACDAQVGTEHLLLGLIREDNLGSGVLVHLGVPLKDLRAQVELKRVEGTFLKLGHRSLSARSKRVVDLAYVEALELQNNHIGAEHLLLGLLREGEGLAAQILAQAGVDRESVRRQIPIVGAEWWKVLQAESRVEEARTAYRAFLRAAHSPGGTKS